MPNIILEMFCMPNANAGGSWRAHTWPKLSVNENKTDSRIMMLKKKMKIDTHCHKGSSSCLPLLAAAAGQGFLMAKDLESASA